MWFVLPVQSTQEQNLLELKYEVRKILNTCEKYVNTSFIYNIRNIITYVYITIERLTDSQQDLFQIILEVEFKNKAQSSSFDSFVLSSTSLDVMNKVKILGERHRMFTKQFNDAWEFDLNIFYIGKIHSYPALYDDELSNLELRGFDGSVSVHKAVIAAWSPVLVKKLRSKSEESNMAYIDLTDTTRAMLQHVKEYIYLHKVPDDVTDLLHLLPFASKYMLALLEEKCADKLINNITKDNAIELFKLAAEHNVVSIISNIFEMPYVETAEKLRRGWLESLNEKSTSSEQTTTTKQNSRIDDNDEEEENNKSHKIIRRINILSLTFNVNSFHTETTTFHYVSNNKIIHLGISYKSREIVITVHLTQVDGVMSFYNQVKLSSQNLAITKEINVGDPDIQIIEQINYNDELDLQFTFYIIPKVHTFPALYTDEVFTNFELRGEGGSVAVHRVVLAAWSPVIKRMLCGNWRETNVGHMDISDISRDTLQHLKEYMYLHKLPDNDVYLRELLLFSSKYMMPELEQMCADKLVTNITEDNANELFKFAAANNASSLIANIFEYPMEDIANELLLSKHCLSLNSLEVST